MGRESYRGSGRLQGKKAIITGGDSGIGRAVAIAFAREGADVLIAYLDEDEDARETARWIEQSGQQAVLVAGDIGSAEHCPAIVARAVETFGRIDILVNNAAHQMTFESLGNGLRELAGCEALEPERIVALVRSLVGKGFASRS
jgi:NAD(P)-dependent dehydrogenase (short-subunit alcohol dehydrogenase family)